MADFEFFVDLEDDSGNKLGGGPLASVTRWRYTARMDRAGDISFEFAANDPQADQVTNRRIARAKALINGAWVEVGAGVIDAIDTIPDDMGRVSLNASGMDLIRELSYRTVGELEIGSGSGATHSAALTAISALAPDGWTFNAASSPDNDFIYARYGGESVLGALVYLAERTQTHFYRGTNRTLNFTSAFTDSGVRAIQARGDLVAETCAIVSLNRQVDTYDLLTRITPYGSGQGAARLTLAATNRVAPTGYTLDAANNYIEADAAKSTYGLVDFPEIEFKEITPISNTDADLQAAANMLFDAALEELKRRSTLADQETYSLTVRGCSQLLRPMQTIRVVYRDVDQGIDIDDDLYILEATWELDASGIRTSNLVVSTDDRWPISDASAAAERAVEGRVFQAHPQLNANSYVTAYNKNVDENNIAAFRFRFGDEVVNLQQVLFEFQLLPFESTVKSVGGDSGGSGDLATDVPSTNSTGSGGNDSTGSGGPTSTSSETPTVGSATPEIGSATPSIGSASLTVSNATPDVGSASLTVSSATPSIGNATPSIGSATPSIGNATPSIGSATPTVGSASPNTGSATPSIGSESLTTASSTPTIGSTTPTIGQTELEAQGREVTTNGTGLETGNPEGGDIVSGGQHGHGVVVFPGVGIHGNVTLHNLGGGNYEFRNNGIGSAVQPNAATLGGNHTHDVDSHTHSIDFHTHAISHHTHTIASHNHTIASHTHTLSAHTHTIASHTHTVASHSHTTTAHTHTIAAHSHTIASHSHTIAAHSHTIASHTHTMSAHTHTIAAHTHTLSAHTHSMEQHTHSLNNHTHDLSESITAIYGIFREEEENTFVIGNLQYQVNSGGWATLNSAVDAGDGWYQLDITDLVMDATTFRPLATNNLLEIRGLMNINDIVHALGNTIVSTEAPHGLEAGDVVTIEGTTNYDGEYEIQFVTNPSAFIIPHDDMGNEFSSPGTITIDKTATIDAQLSVRNTIQAIAYT